MCRARSALAAAAAVFALARGLRAQAVPEHVISEYHTADGCPGEFTFRAQVQARSDRFRVTPAGDPGEPRSATRFVVRLRREGDGYAGTLEVLRGEATSTSELAGATCDEVVAGLSMAAALSSEPAPRARETAPPHAPAVAPTPAAKPMAKPMPWMVAGDLGGRVGYSPRAGLAAGLVLGASLDSGAAFRLALSSTFASDVTSTGSSPLRVDFTWIGGAIDACPWRITTSPNSALLPCASFELGRMQAAASTGEVSRRAWLAPGLVVRFSATLGHLFVEPRLTARAPLIRDRYWFRVSSLAFRTPVVVGEAGMAVGVAF